MPASSFVTRDHAGGAVDTTIVSDITGSSLSITITDPTGWPSGGANGPFYVIASYDVAGKEKIEVQSRTGGTLTIADTGKRGIDGTSAQSHLAGAKIRHCQTALEVDEANEHIVNTGRDDHTQYHTAARHAAVNHTAAMIGADEIGTSEIAPLAVTSAELASGAVTAGKIAAGGISAASQFAAGVVDAAAIATDAVGSAEIAADSVGSSEIAPLAVTSAELAANAVIAGKIAAGGVSASSQLADAIVGMVKLAFETSIGYTPNFNLHNVTLGTGGVQYGRYYKFGSLVFGIAGFALGTGGAVTGPLGFEVPFNSVDRATGHASLATTGWLVVGRCFQNPGGVNASSGLGGFADSTPNVAGLIVTAGTSAGWDSNTPFTWGADDVFQGFFAYEASS